MRQRLRAWAEKHPIWFVLVPMTLYFAYLTPFQMMKQSVTNYWFMAAVESVPVIAVALLVRQLGWWRETGFLGPIRWRGLWVIALPAALIALNFQGIGVSMSNLVAGAFLCFFIGFEEEAWARGVYYQVLMPRYGVMGSALLTSALFGVGHLHNLLSGAPLLGVLVQIVLAVSIGWVFVAVRLRTNSLWPAIIVHALIDFASFIKGSVMVQEESGASALAGLVVALVFFVYGYLAMRGVAANSRYQERSAVV